MFTQDYAWYLRHLMEHIGLDPKNLVFVSDVAEWCRERGIEEPDGKKPLKLVSGNGQGNRVVVGIRIDDDVMNERMTALSIRSQLRSVANDRSERLNSNTRKLAYLLFKEVADSRAEIQGDEFAEDEWIFEQMDEMGALVP
ncbi:MAG TPA: hypothetical protein VIX18_04270 [Nitrospirota bacterium]